MDLAPEAEALHRLRAIKGRDMPAKATVLAINALAPLSRVRYETVKTSASRGPTLTPAGAKSYMVQATVA